MLNIDYNPDVLSCLANLSNDEVFTPPKLVNEILDMLPQELFKNKATTFLDPVTKSGVFLREIAKRLNEGLKDQIPDQQERVNHIFTRQLYGIAITELTALLARRSTYCTKKANGEYSICTTFDSEQGNIKYDRLQHTWQNGRCMYCGASEEVYSRTDDLETYAYQFIHTDKAQNIFNMKFDVIVGNPPYQLSDGGHSRSASPIYHKFIEQAKNLNPRFLIMIIPARWYAGGKGLDQFRNDMLNDDRIRKLVDFENSAEVFPGVDIAGGICYFLWDRDSKGLCEITNQYDEKRVSSERALNEFEIFIRHSKAVPIIRKIHKIESPKHFLNEIISASKPFGLRGNHKPSKEGIRCHFSQRLGLLRVKQDEINDRYKIKDKYKLLIPKSPIAGQTDFSKPVGFYYDGNVIIAKPGEICTETYIVAYASQSEEKVKSFKSYLFTKIFRFLLLQTVVSQDVTREKFAFIPHLDNYNQKFTDEILKKRWNITEEEWEFIDSKIRDI
ncbi:Eco57I restriction-modification methylase domain-containing protein [Christiangramia sabulilitoris]|uniref:site-specific DNA-methyltransferase (adenine-specific) n=1 Tax=Christiangramia sabulilitoris TaxID=2583991 RepID=A0A550I7K1_9FLAO|nr:Eco57I restriction-modification methylase domain-containing protein [Christiangramia sabulilitoris]TRO66952.1 restriction endonuclease [Christiangramia sabulilitoris]